MTSIMACHITRTKIKKLETIIGWFYRIKKCVCVYVKANETTYELYRYILYDSFMSDYVSRSLFNKDAEKKSRSRFVMETERDRFKAYRKKYTELLELMYVLAYNSHIR